MLWILAATLGAVLLGSAAARAAEVPFAAPVAITSAADGASSVYAADLDRDGDLDVLSASANDDKIAWYENNGAHPPTFTAHTISTTADGASSVYAADLDRDGDMDVISASANDDKIAWYENDGARPPSFTARVVSTSADGARSVYAADVDGDGDTDLLSASLNDSKIAWYESNGARPPSFTTRVIHIANGATSVFAKDADEDGDVDVFATFSGDNTVVWYENNGAAPASFTAHNITIMATGATAVHAADVDGDGDTDVLSASAGNDTIAWYESNGASPPSYTARTITTGADGASSLTAADLDGDGDADVLSASESDNRIAWYENNGASPPVFTTRTITSLTVGATAVLAGDVDGDGDLDVLSASAGDDQIRWIENKSPHRSAVFGLPSIIGGAISGVVTITATDLNGDGDQDLATAFSNVSTAGLLFLDNIGGVGTVWTNRTVTTFPAISSLSQIDHADVDGDGDQDLMGGNFNQKILYWWENTAANGTAWTQHTIASGLAAGPNAVAAVDVDGDGDVDAVAVSQNDDRVFWYANTAGNGTTWAAHTIAVYPDVPRRVLGRDLDQDGDQDVITSASLDHRVACFENTAGNGTTWTSRTISNVGPFGTSVSAADLDQDGDTDVVSASSNDQILWHENLLGNGTAWTDHVISTTATSPTDVTVADLDADGDEDVLATAATYDKIAWYENNGASPPGFSEHVIDIDPDGDPYNSVNGFGNPPQMIRTADLDGDGALDVVSASANNARVFWFPDRGGNFGLPTFDVAPIVAVQGARRALLRIDARHNGRSGDADLELASFVLLFEESAGDPLTSAEANALIDDLDVVLDDGSGVYEPGSDTTAATLGTLSLSAGQQTITFTNDDPNVRFQVGAPRTYFIVARMTSNAAAQTPHAFRVTHLTMPGSTAKERDSDLPVTLEFTRAVSSRIVTAGSDSDGDGVPDDGDASGAAGDHACVYGNTVGCDDNCVSTVNPAQQNFDGDAQGDACDADDDNDGLLDVHETNTGIYVSPTDTGTDPLNADTDGDGLDDGAEVAGGSNPVDPDSPAVVPTLGPLGAGLLLLALAWAGRNTLRARVLQH